MEVSNIIFWIFGMTQPGIEPQFPGLVANTVTITSMFVCMNVWGLFNKWSKFYLRSCQEELDIWLGSNISSTESDNNMCIGKAWTAIDRFIAIWKSDFFDKIKQEFFQAVAVSVQLNGCTTWTLMEHWRKSYMRTT